MGRVGGGGGKRGDGAGGGAWGGVGGGGGGVEGGVGDMDFDDVGDSDDSSEGIPLVLVAGALEALRREWRDIHEDEMFFYHRVLGGTWTAKHKGVVADHVAAFCRAGVPRQWCDWLGWPATMSFAYSKYGVVDSHAPARECCCRSDYFDSPWIAEPENDFFAYTTEALGSYEEAEEWVEFLLGHDI